MSWTVAQLTSLFRDLTGRKSTSQISDADVLVELNRYYQYKLPMELKFKLPELKEWMEITTVEDEDVISLPSSQSGSLPFSLATTLGIEYGVINVKGPLHINDDLATLWTDEKRFYEEYPPDYDTTGIPTDALFFGRSLVLRPIPDDAYTVRVQAYYAPNALATDDVDPVHPMLGHAIAYGAAIVYLASKGEKDIADEHGPVYKYELSIIRNYIISQIPIGKRPVGGRF